MTSQSQKLATLASSTPLQQWTLRYWEMISLLRKRPQAIALTITTKKFLRECPPEFVKLRQRVTAYQDKLMVVRASA